MSRSQRGHARGSASSSSPSPAASQPASPRVSASPSSILHWARTYAHPQPSAEDIAREQAALRRAVEQSLATPPTTTTTSTSSSSSSLYSPFDAVVTLHSSTDSLCAYSRYYVMEYLTAPQPSPCVVVGETWLGKAELVRVEEMREGVPVLRCSPSECTVDDLVRMDVPAPEGSWAAVLPPAVRLVFCRHAYRRKVARDGRPPKRKDALIDLGDDSDDEVFDPPLPSPSRTPSPSPSPSPSPAASREIFFSDAHVGMVRTRRRHLMMRWQDPPALLRCEYVAPLPPPAPPTSTDDVANMLVDLEDPPARILSSVSIDALVPAPPPFEHRGRIKVLHEDGVSLPRRYQALLAFLLIAPQPYITALSWVPLNTHKLRLSTAGCVQISASTLEERLLGDEPVNPALLADPFEIAARFPFQQPLGNTPAEADDTTLLSDCVPRWRTSPHPPLRAPWERDRPDSALFHRNVADGVNHAQHTESAANCADSMDPFLLTQLGLNYHLLHTPWNTRFQEITSLPCATLEQARRRTVQLEALRADFSSFCSSVARLLVRQRPLRRKLIPPQHSDTFGAHFAIGRCIFQLFDDARSGQLNAHRRARAELLMANLLLNMDTAPHSLAVPLCGTFEFRGHLVLAVTALPIDHGAQRASMVFGSTSAAGPSSQRRSPLAEHVLRRLGRTLNLLPHGYLDGKRRLVVNYASPLCRLHLGNDARLYIPWAATLLPCFHRTGESTPRLFRPELCHIAASHEPVSAVIHDPESPALANVPGDAARDLSRRNAALCDTQYGRVVDALVQFIVECERHHEQAAPYSPPGDEPVSLAEHFEPHLYDHLAAMTKEYRLRLPLEFLRLVGLPVSALGLVWERLPRHSATRRLCLIEMLVRCLKVETDQYLREVTLVGDDAYVMHIFFSFYELLDPGQLYQSFWDIAGELVQRKFGVQLVAEEVSEFTRRVNILPKPDGLDKLEQAYLLERMLDVMAVAWNKPRASLADVSAALRTLREAAHDLGHRLSVFIDRNVFDAISQMKKVPRKTFARRMISVIYEQRNKDLATCTKLEVKAIEFFNDFGGDACVLRLATRGKVVHVRRPLQPNPQFIEDPLIARAVELLWQPSPLVCQYLVDNAILRGAHRYTRGFSEALMVYVKRYAVCRHQVVAEGGARVVLMRENVKRLLRQLVALLSTPARRWAIRCTMLSLVAWTDGFQVELPLARAILEEAALRYATPNQLYPGDPPDWPNDTLTVPTHRDTCKARKAAPADVVDAWDVGGATMPRTPSDRAAVQHSHARLFAAYMSTLHGAELVDPPPKAHDGEWVASAASLSRVLVVEAQAVLRQIAVLYAKAAGAAPRRSPRDVPCSPTQQRDDNLGAQQPLAAAAAELSSRARTELGKLPLPLYLRMPAPPASYIHSAFPEFDSQADKSSQAVECAMEEAFRSPLAALGSVSVPPEAQAHGGNHRWGAEAVSGETGITPLLDAGAPVLDASLDGLGTLPVDAADPSRSLPQRKPLARAAIVACAGALKLASLTFDVSRDAETAGLARAQADQRALGQRDRFGLKPRHSKRNKSKRSSNSSNNNAVELSEATKRPVKKLVTAALRTVADDDIAAQARPYEGAPTLCAPSTLQYAESSAAARALLLTKQHEMVEFSNQLLSSGKVSTSLCLCGGDSSCAECETTMVGTLRTLMLAGQLAGFTLGLPGVGRQMNHSACLAASFVFGADHPHTLDAELALTATLVRTGPIPIAERALGLARARFLSEPRLSLVPGRMYRLQLTRLKRGLVVRAGSGLDAQRTVETSVELSKRGTCPSLIDTSLILAAVREYVATGCSAPAWLLLDYLVAAVPHGTHTRCASLGAEIVRTVDSTFKSLDAQVFASPPEEDPATSVRPCSPTASLYFLWSFALRHHFALDRQLHSLRAFMLLDVAQGRQRGEYDEQDLLELHGVDQSMQDDATLLEQNAHVREYASVALQAAAMFHSGAVPTNPPSTQGSERRSSSNAGTPSCSDAASVGSIRVPASACFFTSLFGAAASEWFQFTLLHEDHAHAASQALLGMADWVLADVSEGKSIERPRRVLVARLTALALDVQLFFGGGVRTDEPVQTQDDPRPPLEDVDDLPPPSHMLPMMWSEVSGAPSAVPPSSTAQPPPATYSTPQRASLAAHIQLALLVAARLIQAGMSHSARNLLRALLLDGLHDEGIDPTSAPGNWYGYESTPDEAPATIVFPEHLQVVVACLAEVQQRLAELQPKSAEEPNMLSVPAVPALMGEMYAVPRDVLPPTADVSGDLPSMAAMLEESPHADAASALWTCLVPGSEETLTQNPAMGVVAMKQVAALEVMEGNAERAQRLLDTALQLERRYYHAKWSQAKRRMAGQILIRDAPYPTVDLMRLTEVLKARADVLTIRGEHDEAYETMWEGLCLMLKHTYCDTVASADLMARFFELSVRKPRAQAFNMAERATDAVQRLRGPTSVMAQSTVVSAARVMLAGGRLDEAEKLLLRFRNVAEPRFQRFFEAGDNAAEPPRPDDALPTPDSDTPLHDVAVQLLGVVYLKAGKKKRAVVCFSYVLRRCLALVLRGADRTEAEVTRMFVSAAVALDAEPVALLNEITMPWPRLSRFGLMRHLNRAETGPAEIGPVPQDIFDLVNVEQLCLDLPADGHVHILNLITTCNNLALAYWYADSTRYSQWLIKMAIEFCELLRGLDPDCPRVRPLHATCLLNLAALASGSAEAQRLYRAAVQRIGEVQDGDTPRLLASVAAHSGMHFELQHKAPEKSLRGYEEELARLVAAVGDEHITVAMLRWTIAAFYQRNSRFDEALIHYEAAQPVLERARHPHLEAFSRMYVGCKRGLPLAQCPRGQ